MKRIGSATWYILNLLMHKKSIYFFLVCSILLATYSIFFVITKNNKRYSLPSISVEEPTLRSPSAAEQKSVTLLFGGDLMFDRSIRSSIDENGVDFILSELYPLFSTYDAVVANLEGPVTDNPSISLGSEPGSARNFSFTFSPLITDLLKKSNISIVNLGNNHITNFGTDGIIQTKKYLIESTINYFGDTGNETQSTERVLIKIINNQTIAFVNYNQFAASGFEHALEDVAFANADPTVDTIIVYTHWGNEYVPTANTVIQNQAHSIIDAGADLIIGSHPHVIQNKEVYNGKTIYYSLGNFVFDQYFSKETTEGLLVAVEIVDDGNMTFYEIPVRLLVTGKTVLSD